MICHECGQPGQGYHEHHKERAMSVKLQDNPIHALFSILPVADTCTWYGTEWVGNGKEAKLKNCGEPTVASAVFCEDSTDHKHCSYFSLCERHSARSERYDSL